MGLVLWPNSLSRQKTTNSLDCFFGRIYSTPICLRFYLTFSVVKYLAKFWVFLPYLQKTWIRISSCFFSFPFKIWGIYDADPNLMDFFSWPKVQFKRLFLHFLDMYCRIEERHVFAMSKVCKRMRCKECKVIVSICRFGPWYDGM